MKYFINIVAFLAVMLLVVSCKDEFFTAGHRISA